MPAGVACLKSKVVVVDYWHGGKAKNGEKQDIPTKNPLRVRARRKEFFNCDVMMVCG
jgi:hypothetical protein